MQVLSTFNVHTCNCLLFSPSATYRDLAGRIKSYSYSSLSGPGYEASLKHSASNFEIMTQLTITNVHVSWGPSIHSFYRFQRSWSLFSLSPRPTPSPALALACGRKVHAPGNGGVSRASRDCALSQPDTSDKGASVISSFSVLKEYPSWGCR